MHAARAHEIGEEEKKDRPRGGRGPTRGVSCGRKRNCATAATWRWGWEWGGWVGVGWRGVGGGGVEGGTNGRACGPGTRARLSRPGFFFWGAARDPALLDTGRARAHTHTQTTASQATQATAGGRLGVGRGSAGGRPGVGPGSARGRPGVGRGVAARPPARPPARLQAHQRGQGPRGDPSGPSGERMSGVSPPPPFPPFPPPSARPPAPTTARLTVRGLPPTTAPARAAIA